MTYKIVEIQNTIYFLSVVQSQSKRLLSILKSIAVLSIGIVHENMNIT